MMVTLHEILFGSGVIKLDRDKISIKADKCAVLKTEEFKSYQYFRKDHFISMKEEPLSRCR